MLHHKLNPYALAVALLIAAVAGCVVVVKTEKFDGPKPARPPGTNAPADTNTPPAARAQ